MEEDDESRCFMNHTDPAILETTVSKRFVKIVNTVADDVLSDEDKSKKWDYHTNCRW